MPDWQVTAQQLIAAETRRAKAAAAVARAEAEQAAANTRCNQAHEILTAAEKDVQRIQVELRKQLESEAQGASAAPAQGGPVVPVASPIHVDLGPAPAAESSSSSGKGKGKGKGSSTDLDPYK